MRSCDVTLGNQTVGQLHERASHGSFGSVFLYERAFAEAPTRPVLSQSLLDQLGVPLDIVADDGLVSFFSNLLPETGPLRRYLATRQHVDETDDFALLAALGQNLPGAVIVTPRDAEPQHVQPHPECVPQDDHWRFSLAGVQMKFSATRSLDGWVLAPIAQPAEWIVKLPTSEYPGLVENEFAMMSFARACGLRVPETQLIDLTTVRDLDPRFLNPGTVGYAIKRYDRTEHGRIHQEDFCQVFGLPPQAKYGKDARKGAEDVLRVVYELCSPEEAQEWLRSLAFSLAIGNADAHLKNYAIVYPDGQTPQLSPVYDLICVLRYNHRATLALPIAGVHSFPAITNDVLDAMGAAAAVSKRLIRAAFRDMSDMLKQQWPHVRDTIADDETRSIIEHRIANVMPTFGRNTKTTYI